MHTLLHHHKNVEHDFLQYFQYHPASVQRAMPEDMPVESSRKYRDTAVWRLLCLEDYVDVSDLISYWEIMDAMMDISIASAINLLQNLYEYRVRKLQAPEKRRLYPETPNDLYRLEYDDERGGYRDICARTLINEAIDLLQAEAERLVHLNNYV